MKKIVSAFIAMLLVAIMATTAFATIKPGQPASSAGFHLDDNYYAVVSFFTADSNGIVLKIYKYDDVALAPIFVCQKTLGQLMINKKEILDGRIYESYINFKLASGGNKVRIKVIIVLGVSGYWEVHIAETENIYMPSAQSPQRRQNHRAVS